MKNKKHDRITKDYEKQKSKHLDRLTSKMLKDDERMQKLKGYGLKKDPFDFFDEDL